MNFKILLRLILIYCLCSGVVIPKCNTDVDIRAYDLTLEQFEKVNQLIKERGSDKSFAWKDLSSILQKSGFDLKNNVEMTMVPVSLKELNNIEEAFNGKPHINVTKKYSHFFFVKCDKRKYPKCIMTKDMSNPKEEDKTEIYIKDKYGRVWCCHSPIEKESDNL